MSDFEQWAEEKRAEAFSLAVERMADEGLTDAELEEGLQAESDVMRALNAHGLLP
jgi:hypothetical protein